MVGAGDVQDNFKDQLVYSGLWMLIRWRPGNQYEIKYASPGFLEGEDPLRQIMTADSFLNRIHPEDRERIERLNTAARLDLKEWHEEFQFQCTTGLIRVEGFASYQRGKDGSLSGYLFLIETTSFRREGDLVNDPEFLATQLEGIVELSPGGHYAISLDPDGHSQLLYVSRKVQEIIGLDMNEFREDARKMFNHIHPDDAVRFRAGRMEAIRKCESWRVEFRLMNRSGTDTWIELSIQPFKQRDGSVIWYGILMNIDQRKNLEMARQQAYDQLKESEYKHRQLTENIDSPVIIIDEEGTFYYANHAAEYFFGVARIDLIGRKWPETITPLEWESRRSIIQRVLREERKFADMWCVAPDGKKRYIRRMFIPLQYLGRTCRVLVTISDITSDVLLEKTYAESGASITALP